MGLASYYFAVNETELDEITQQTDVEEIFEKLEEISERDDDSYTDFDKLWEGLHFLLTGYNSDDDYNAKKSPQDLAIYQAFFGLELIPSTKNDTNVYYITSDKVKELAKVICGLKFSDFSQNVDFDKFTNNDIYPDIWCNEDKDDLLEELEEYFDNLQNFYQNASDNNLSVITYVG